MSEQLPVMPRYVQRLFDYFLGRPEDDGKRAEYMRRGLIPTNNLSLYIVDDPAAEIVPGTGIANPYDYRRKPFKHIIEGLKVNHPELWERAKEVEAKTTAIGDSYWETIKGQGAESPEAAQVAAQFEAISWLKAEVYTQVIQILGPQMEAEGLDPIEICG